MSDFSTPDLRPTGVPDDNWRIYRGESMLRVFVPGDLLRVEKIAATQAEVGDIIAFDTPRGSVTVHRAIARKRNGELVTMGDNNPHPDFSPVKPDTTVLRVVEVRRGDGKAEAVSGGKVGMTEFRRNRRRRWFKSELPRYAAGVCRRLWPFKRRLHAPVRFGEEEFFYVRQKPVAKRSSDGRVRWFSPWYRVIYRIG
jgi:hypothetical protein